MKVSGNFWDSFIVYSVEVLGGGESWIIWGLSTKKYPTRLMFPPDKNHLKTSWFPAYLRELISGFLTMVHISVVEMFPYPSPL